MRTGAAALLTCLLTGCPVASPSVPTWDLTDPATSVVVPDLPAGSTTGDGGGSTTGAPADDSGPGSSTGDAFPDAGPAPDIGTLGPKGCNGKIDFLFVISSHNLMQPMQAKAIDAFADFHATIAAQFADFDYHIMVVDGDLDWGNSYCNNDACEQSCAIEGYPCELVDQLTACDLDIGAGHVSNAGNNSSNRDCGVVGGRRYLTRDQPDLGETFSCLARVGTDGNDALALAATSALAPDIRGPGGCNEGFLRDDALLMITFLITGDDGISPGYPDEWAQAIIDAKNGDPGSIVMFGLLMPNCVDNKFDRLCRMLTMFEYSHIESNLIDDYGPAFVEATALVDAACTAFIPK